MAMQSTDSLGFEVLRGHYAEFCKSGVDPVNTAFKLFEANLINAGARDECLHGDGGRDLRLGTIIDNIMRQGKPGAFQEFTEIVTEDTSWLGDKLKRTY